MRKQGRINIDELQNYLNESFSSLSQSLKQTNLVGDSVFSLSPKQKNIFIQKARQNKPYLDSQEKDQSKSRLKMHSPIHDDETGITDITHMYNKKMLKVLQEEHEKEVKR